MYRFMHVSIQSSSKLLPSSIVGVGFRCDRDGLQHFHFQFQKYGLFRQSGVNCYSISRKLNTSSSEAKKKDNIILMGSPGSGKTTIGRIVADKLGLPAYDIDDHLLEPYWKMTVADKLAEVGSSGFVEAEGKALLQCDVSGKVVSLTGSNPMNKEAMDKMSKTGTVVFLDVSNKEILERLEKMKVNRIVGQGDGMSMSDILKYRQQFYENNYDLRILCEAGETQESIAGKVVSAVKSMDSDKGYVSSRGGDTIGGSGGRVSLSDAILTGLAPDGGLYVPSSELPKFSVGEMDRLVNLDYNSRALRILERVINPSDVHPSVLANFISNAYNEDNFLCNKIFPLHHLEANQYLIELFHGPTASFKDAALQLMPQLFVEALKQKGLYRKKRFLIVVATSGDTGGAVLDGFSKHAGDSGVGVIVLYPEHGVSSVQKRQMLSLAGNNVQVFGVEGDFDKCQSFVKKALKDTNLAERLREQNNCRLSAANSISWGRLLPQVVYHSSAYLDLVQKGVIKSGEEVDLCIPTGNFGNILAAYYAKRMGIPFRRLICASNSNNAVTQFINTGTYDIRSVQLQRTASPAIDILVSSNLERYLYHISGSTDDVRRWFQQLEQEKYFTIDDNILEEIQGTFVAKWCSEDECKAMIQRTLQNTGYLLDPHTAVAKVVADSFNTKDVPLLIASTAHYSKFAPEILHFFGYNKKKESLIDQYRKLEKMCKMPVMHASMETCAKLPYVEEKVLKPNYEDFLREINHFAEKLP